MENVKIIYSYSFSNKSKLDSVKKCGCGYCLKIYDTNEIKEWISDKNDETAICPYCRIDCVIPESKNKKYKLSKELLEKINKEYF